MLNSYNQLLYTLYSFRSATIPKNGEDADVAQN